MALNIVLVEPEIPHNTGSIARTCALTGTVLHLVRPLGFSINDRHLKRAGLDYWPLVQLKYYDSLQEVFDNNPDGDFYFATTKAEKNYAQFSYRDNSFFVFGKETKGLPESLVRDNIETAIRIPMKKNIARSLNLSNSANIIIYEALRQLDFPELK
ncbi:tRNA (cytidine(34)-2'-O)-methyltransferase [Gudongella sp. SC589]|uniref:tRNA (cytidine(34)-2'-O)-methyltransferase n=1 Tax=Gudongella sp. SC589 TaxID=3385990 RepID=UPI003904AFEA